MIGINERTSGLYILGRPGMGKTNLILNLIQSDIDDKRGFFFIDPHVDALKQVLAMTKKAGAPPPIYLDPERDTLTFCINPLSCSDISSLSARTDTYNRTYKIFYKLWEWDFNTRPWLSLIIQHLIHVFIENPGYTLADAPLFLRSRDFRHALLNNMRYNKDAFDFWHYEFEEKKDAQQQEQASAALTRIRMLLGHPQVRDILASPKSTLDFASLLQEKRGILVKLSANLAQDIRSFIGAILISELLHAVRNRPEGKRDIFSVYVDEFQHFATSDDFTTLITEARKFGVATTISHQTRSQLEDKKLLGATQAAANKILFQLTPADALELAPEFSLPSPAEIKTEPEMVLSREPFEELLRRGHANPIITRYLNTHARRVIERYEERKFRIDQMRTEHIPYVSRENDVWPLQKQLIEKENEYKEACATYPRLLRKDKRYYGDQVELALAIIASYEALQEHYEETKRRAQWHLDLKTEMAMYEACNIHRREISLLLYTIMQAQKLTPEMISKRAWAFALSSDIDGAKEDFLEFCRLFALPENAVKVAGGQYTQKEVPLHSTSEMNARTARELAELHPYTCYAKIIKDGKIEKQKVQTTRVVTPQVSGLTYWGGVLIPREQVMYLREERTKRWRGGFDPPPASSPVP